MTVKFTNNASTTVATGINTTATSLVVASAAGFPALSGSGDYCYLTIQQAAGTNVEVVKATALSSNTFTIVRAQDGTSAGSWSVSDVVELRVTAALLTDIVDAATHDNSVLAVDSTNNRVGVNDTTPSVTLDISGTDAIALPVGTTAERPTGAAGRFRYNSSLSQFEGYTDAWGAIGGGGTNTFTTDTFTANGSLVAFNLSQTVASANNLLCFIDGVFQTQDAYAIATASGTTTLTFSAAPANGRKIVVYSVAAGISGTNLNVDSMTGDGSDVTLTLTINTIKENTQVFIDGVYQAKANYSISGTTLTFSTAPPAGSAVECVTMTQTEINVPVDGTITPAKIASGDFYFDTNTLYVDATNNRVGIGSTTVNRKLEVAGNNNGGAKANYIRITDTDTTATANNQAGGIEFFTNDVTAGIAASIEVLYAGTGGGGEITFNTNASSSGTLTEALRIDESGSVGIGTNSPSTTLTVVGSGDAETGATITHSRSGVGYSLLLNNTNNGANKGSGIKWQGGGFDTAAIIGRSDATAASGDAPGYLTFHTSADGSEGLNERMRIDSSGIITTPYQPAFGVAGNLYTSTAIFRGGAVHSNVGGHFNTTTGIFTAPVAGTYSFMFNLSTQDTQSHFVDIFINGLSSLGHSLQYGVIYTTGSMAINVTLAALDSVSARKRSSSYATYNATFSGHLIG